MRRVIGALVLLAAFGATRAWAEPPERPSLVVATTKDGDLLVIDEHGTLRGRARLPYSPEGQWIATYMLAAGRLGGDGWFVAVRLLKDTYVYALHPERLPKD